MRFRLLDADTLCFGPQQKKQPKIPPDEAVGDFLPPIFSFASATAFENPPPDRSLEEFI